MVGTLETTYEANSHQSLLTFLNELGESSGEKLQVLLAEARSHFGDSITQRLRELLTDAGLPVVTKLVTQLDKIILSHLQAGNTIESLIERLRGRQLLQTLRIADANRFSLIQLMALTDAALSPRRRISRAQLCVAITMAAAQGITHANGVAALLGSPVALGADTGSVQIILQVVKVAQLNQEEIKTYERLMSEEQYGDLSSRLSHLVRDELAEQFMSALESLPDELLLPQTTAFAAGDLAGYTTYTGKQTKQ